MRSVLVALGVVSVLACGADPSGSEPPPSRARGGSLTGLAVAVTTAPVRAGGELDFTFTNGGRSVVTTGVLSCVNHYERDAGDGTWTRLEPFRVCILLGVIHRPGDSSGHTTPAPDSPGTYRLVVEAHRYGDGQETTVRSAPFEVLSAP